MQAEHAQPGQVDRGGQQVEVGGDLGKAADPNAAAAVAAADQMGQLALDLGPGRAVVGGTDRVGLAGTGSRQFLLVGGDGDGAAGRRSGALAAKRAAGAGGTEAGLAVVAVVWIGVVDDRGGVLGGAGDGAGGKVDLELVFGEVSLGCDRGLDLDPRVDAGGVQAGQQRPGAIGAIAIDGGRRRWPTVPSRRGGDRYGGVPLTWSTSSASNGGAAAASPTLPAVAAVAMTSSLSG